MESFYDQVDPDRALAEDERERRATAARKAYFARLGAKSADVRRRRSAVSQLRAELAELEAGDSDVA